MGRMFARGYQASRAEKERQDKARENAGKKLWRFFLSDDGDEADLRFLTEEPVNFYEHIVRNTRNGKEYFDNVETVSAGSFKHNKLNSTEHFLEASDEAELLIVCTNKVK